MKTVEVEVEVKILLGTEDNAQKFIQTLKSHNPHTYLNQEHKQLNHYFVDVDLALLLARLNDRIHIQQQEQFKDLMIYGINPSVRTREIVGESVKLVLKASKDTVAGSENEVTRYEFEQAFDMKLEDLDQILIECGGRYQAKWSRYRREYISGDFTVCIDKNAGYGYVAEIEKMVSGDTDTKLVELELRLFIKKLGYSELAPDRLQRMFQFYNQHWDEYYGSEKIFEVQ